MLVKGKVYLVGAGPGDPGLLTLRAKELLSQCDLLVFDNLVNPKLRKWTKKDCRQIDVGKSPGRHTVDQVEIGKTLISNAKEGLSVVRLKGGDPFVFGRCAEEMSMLDSAGVAYEIVPGITAAIACAAYAGIPLTHREYGSSISFLTGHEEIAKESLRVDFTKFAKVGGTLCIYMGMSKLADIVERLVKGGLSLEEPVAVVSQGTLPVQKHLICSLGELVSSVKEAELIAPAIIFIGNAVGLAKKVSWYENRPLFGKRFVVTRASRQNGKVREKLEHLGAEVLELPLIEILPTENRNLVAEIFAGIATYEWAVFTSSNGAREFMKIFLRAFEDIRSFGPMKIACVGEATASVFRDFQLQVELIPEISTAENLAQTLISTDSLDSANVLVVSGNRNREILVGILEKIGHAIVDVLPVYDTDFADVSEASDLKSFKELGADGIIFTSSSTALSYIEQEDDLQLHKGATIPLLCSLGSETSKTLRENDLCVGLEAENPNLDSLLEGLLKKFGRIETA